MSLKRYACFSKEANIQSGLDLQTTDVVKRKKLSRTRWKVMIGQRKSCDWTRNLTDNTSGNILENRSEDQLENILAKLKDIRSQWKKWENLTQNDVERKIKINK